MAADVNDRPIAVWGTPHNPGYPLYIVVSHLLAKLPVGTLAFRINLMSAVFGALAAGLLVLVVARLTDRIDAAICAGIGLALGRTFWSQSIVAEVHGLATALLVATLLFGVRWTDTRSTRDLMLTVGMAALAVGNHLTIVVVAPGLIVMVLATD